MRLHTCSWWWIVRVTACVLCLLVSGCATKTTQQLEIQPGAALELRENALVSGDTVLQLVAECVTSQACNDGFGDTKRQVDYVTSNVQFHYLLETKNSDWIAAMAGVPTSVAQSAASAVAGAARYCNPF